MRRESLLREVGWAPAAWVFWGLSLAASLPSARAATAPEITKGIFLVADPRLRDPNFARTVVLITGHGRQGSMGIVVNRPSRMLLSEALPQIRELQGRTDRLFIGGPVQQNKRLALLREERPLPETAPIFEQVYLTESAAALSEFLSRRGPVSFRVYSGYAGWGPGQLRAEIDRGDWRLIPADAAALFREDPQNVWREMLDRSLERIVHR